MRQRSLSIRRGRSWTEMVRILTQEEAAKDGLEEAGERTETEWMAKQPKIQMAE